MSNSTHKSKVKMARRLQTNEERKAGKSIFESGKYSTSKWKDRKIAIAERVKRKQDAAHARAVERKKKAKEEKNK